MWCNLVVRQSGRECLRCYAWMPDRQPEEWSQVTGRIGKGLGLGGNLMVSVVILFEVDMVSWELLDDGSEQVIGHPYSSFA